MNFKQYRAIIIAVLACVAMAVVFYTGSTGIMCAAGTALVVAAVAMDRTGVSGGGSGSFLEMVRCWAQPSTCTLHAEQALGDLKTFGEANPANTAEKYRHMRHAYHALGADKFKAEMTAVGWFSGDRISTSAKPFNPFARLVAKEDGSLVDPTTEDKAALDVPYGNLIRQHLASHPNGDAWNRKYMVARNRPELDAAWGAPNAVALGASMSERHRFLLLRDLDWRTFNVLTFPAEQKYIDLLRDMRDCAMAYAHAENPAWTNVGLYFHCYPKNSVQALHLHMVDKDRTGPVYDELQSKNLLIDMVIEVLEEEMRLNASRISDQN